MRVFATVICLIFSFSFVMGQVDVLDLIPGDDVKITMNNGAILEGTAGTFKDNQLEVTSRLNKEFLVEADSIQNIFSKAHEKYDYIFPARHEINLIQRASISLYLKNGLVKKGKYHFHDKDYIHIHVSTGGIHKVELSSIHYIKARSQNSRGTYIYGGLTLAPGQFYLFNYGADFKLVESHNSKSLFYAGLTGAVTFGGAGVLGNMGLRQCFGSNGQYFEVSAGLLIREGAFSEFGLGYRYENDKFIFRGGFSLIAAHYGGLYLSIGF